MKTFISKFTVLFVVCFLVSSVDLMARGRGGGGYRRSYTRTVEVEVEKIVYVLCEGCREHLPIVNPPKYADGLKVEHSPYDSVKVTVNVDSNTVAHFSLNKDRKIFDLRIWREGRLIYNSSARDSGVRVNLQEWEAFWEAFAKTIPVFTLAPAK